MAYLLERRRSALPIPKKKRRMTMATFLSSSLDALQDQDPPPACRLRRRREKLGRSWHGASRCHSRVMLPGHGGGGWQLSSKERKKMTMAITLSFLGLKQTSSSLEHDGIGHGHLHNSPLTKGGRPPWSSPSPSQDCKGRLPLFKKLTA